MAAPASGGAHRPASGVGDVPVAIYPDRHPASARFRRNPGAWGVAFGEVVVLVSLFLVWIEVTNRSSGVTERVRAISNFSGQTLFFAAILGIGAGVAIAMVTSTAWRVFWAVAALALGGLCLVAAAWAVFDASGFAWHAANAQQFASATAQWEMRDASARLSVALASGAVSATAAVGAVVGLVGGALAVVGALLSFAPPRPSPA